MSRSLASVAVVLWFLGPTLAARAIEVGAAIERVDAERGVLVFNANGSRRTARVAADARFSDPEGKELTGGLRSPALRAGAVVVVTVEPVEGRPVVRAIRLAPPGAPARAAQPAALPPVDTSGLKALTDMEPSDSYQGSPGGLYPNGANQRPAPHEKAGLALAATIRPLDPEGRPAENGKIGLLAIGFSNTLQCFNGFIDAARSDESIDPHVVLVNGAQGGRSAFMIQNPDDHAVGEQYWRTWVPEHLKARGVAPAQVQVVWLKETDANLNPGMLKTMGLREYRSPLREKFPESARILEAELERIVQAIPRFFPNVKLVYVSSRSYGGWAKREGNREPFSYETGFAVKWLIADQLAGDPALNFDPARGPVKAPWLSWGPYLWANGTVPRRDGFVFALTDYRADDQMHHSAAGMKKMGLTLLQFFKTDSTTRGWFLAAKP